MDFSLLSEENYDIELYKVFAKLDKMIFLKESVIEQVSASHILLDSLKSENIMLLNTINELENKLEKVSSDNLKRIPCIHSDVSNKPDLTVNDLSTSTSHASDSELDSIGIKPVIEDSSCLDNSCLTNHVMPKSKE